MRRAIELAALGAAVLAGGLAGDAVGLPSPYLFAAILAGLAVSLLAPGRVEPPPLGFRAAQAVTGVAIGAYFQSSTFTALGTRWIPVGVISLATLGLSLAVGLAVARLARLDRTTATLGMVAGGAAGIVAMTDDLGGDDRLVAFMQYLRVLVIVLLTPVLVALFFPGQAGTGDAPGDGPLLGDPEGWALTAVVAAGGALIGSRLRLPAGAMLGPLVLAAALTLLDFPDEFTVPPLLHELAFALIGLQVGLHFDRAAVRRIASIAPVVFGAIGALIAVSFGLAALLSWWTDVPLLDCYLATTPGGLYAVLAIAFGSGVDTTFVLAVQALRLLAMALVAPGVVRLITRS